MRWRFVLVLCACWCCVRAHALQQTVYTCVQFIQALGNHSTTLLLVENDLDCGADGVNATLAAHAGFLISRNVTVQSSGVGPGLLQHAFYPAIIWRYQTADFRLAAGTTLTFYGLLIKNSRNLCPDLVQQSPYGTIVMSNCIKHNYAGVPPSAANSLTTQPRPPWAPRASNSVALLPLGACRRGPPPALCWAAAYEMVDLVTEVVVPGGAAAVRLQVMRTTLVMEEPISSTCLAQIYARNTSCVDSLSSSLQAQEARSPKGWLDQALDTSRQALLDAGSDPSGPPPSSEGKNVVTAVGAGVGVGIGVPLLALVVLSALRRSCVPPPLSRQLLNWKQWLNRDKSAKLQICPTATGSATDGYQETKLPVQGRDPACGLHPAGQPMTVNWRQEHPLHGSQRHESAHSAPALDLALVAVQSSSSISASAAGLGRHGASEGATSVSPSFHAQGATAKMFKLSIQESDSRTGFTGDLQQPYLLHGPLCGSNFGQGLLTSAQEPQPDSSPALLAGGDEPRCQASSTDDRPSSSQARELAEHIRQVHSFAVPAALTELVTDALPIHASINLAVNVERDVKIGPFLGSGMAGNVYQATYQGQQIAIKMFLPGADLRSFSQEISILGRTAHPNIVRLLGACFHARQVSLLEELCHGSLEELMHPPRRQQQQQQLSPLPSAMPKDPQDSAEAASLGTAANTAAKLPLLQGALPLRAVLHLAIQIAQGLAFLHPTIIHRDLKPGNVLLLRDPAAAALLPGPGTHTSSLDGSERGPALPAPQQQQQQQHAGVASGSANSLQGSCTSQADGAAEQEASLLQLRVKLSDFGLARMRAAITMQTNNPQCGTIPYMSPECFMKANGTGLTHKCDMYSFGVCLWEMLHGRRPWAGFSAAEIMFAVAVKQQPLPFSLPPTRCPPQLARLVMLCTDHDPIRRPSALEAVRELALLQQCLFPVLPPPALTATSGSQGSGSEPKNSNSNNGTSA